MFAKRSFAMLLVLTLAITSVVVAQNRLRRQPTGDRKTIEHDDMQRVYRVHVPKSYDDKKKVSLVLLLHGGGGDADQGSKMGMTPLADKHGFIVVYPEGIDKHWNDGRKSALFREHDAKIDDVAFIRALVESLQKEYAIDDSKIFTCGASNGGFMSQRLAIEMSDVFSGAGIMIATMGEPLKKDFSPKHPVSMFFMNGTQDPLVPYDGGDVRVQLLPQLKRKPASRGVCLPTDEVVSLWVDRNKIKKKPLVKKLPDSNKNDDCTTERTLWTDGESGTAVALYRVIGGGHTVPGGDQYLPKRVIGNTCRDFNGLEAMWDFFEKHARKSE